MLSLSVHIYNKILRSDARYKFVKEDSNGQSNEFAPFLIEGTLNINYTHEYTKPFDFIASSASFQLIGEASQTGYLNLNDYSSPDKILVFSIKNDDLYEMSGYLDIQSSYYDRDNDIYNITIIDMFKLLYDNWEDKPLGAGNLSSLDTAITDSNGKGFYGAIPIRRFQRENGEYGYFENGDVIMIGRERIRLDGRVVDETKGIAVYMNSIRGYESTPILVHEKDNQVWQYILPAYPSLGIFLSYYNIFEENKVIIDIADMSENFIAKDWKHMAIQINTNDFLLEVQKYYNSILYFDGERKLVFKSKLQSVMGAVVDITKDVYEGSIVEYFKGSSLYNSFLINLRDPSKGWSGYAFVYMDNDEVKYTIINADLSNIPIQYKNTYIDLRTNLPRYNEETKEYVRGFGFDEILFPTRTPERVKQIYWNLLTGIANVKCTMDGLNISPLQVVKLDGAIHVVQNIDKNFDTEESNLELLKV